MYIFHAVLGDQNSEGGKRYGIWLSLGRSDKVERSAPRHGKSSIGMTDIKVDMDCEVRFNYSV
jgi:hypothetical protein